MSIIVVDRPLIRVTYNAPTNVPYVMKD